MTARFALRASLAGTLGEGWLYLPTATSPTLDTECAFVEDWDEESTPEGFPVEGLEDGDIRDTIHAAKLLSPNPSDELLLESFVYYWRFDAFLPSVGATDPP